jgi:hypothetical protein
MISLPTARFSCKYQAALAILEKTAVRSLARTTTVNPFGPARSYHLLANLEAVPPFLSCCCLCRLPVTLSGSFGDAQMYIIKFLVKSPSLQTFGASRSHHRQVTPIVLVIKLSAFQILAAVLFSGRQISSCQYIVRQAEVSCCSVLRPKSRTPL